MAQAVPFVAGIASTVVGVSAYNQQKKAYRQQQGTISEQKHLNEEVAAFNKGVLNKLYPETLEMIKLQTRP